MIDFTTLPSSESVQSNKSISMMKGVNFTSTENMAPDVLYKTLTSRLMTLEKSSEMDANELSSIKEATIDFRLETDEKEDLLLRISWLDRLYEVEKAFPSVESKEEAKRLLRVLSIVPRSPMKNELIVKLTSLVKSLPSEKIEKVQQTDMEHLTERAFEKAGDTFINLGKTGRDFIIAKVLQQFGTEVTIENIQQQSNALEKRVISLTDVKEQMKLIGKLENLPIRMFKELSIDRKVKIADRLIEMNNWNDLATLERLIVQENKSIAEEEIKQSNIMDTLNDQFSDTLDLLTLIKK